tara:strand:+ start:1543 stop:2286 length:744 start_codon:yes stop_codon:yes gene_type:complete
MALKIQLNYSLNFNLIKRSSKQIKFLIFHYTGMKKESDAINRLTSMKSKVSSHYFIKNNGDIILMVPDLYAAWHAGRSSWKNYKFLNKYSIGIEINNPGHRFNYKKYSIKQINSILSLSKYLIKKYKIKKKNILGHSDIAPNRKKDPGEKFPWKYLASRKIGIWHTLSNKLLKKNRQIKITLKDKKNFLKNLYQLGYSKSSFKNSNETHNIKLTVKAFQRRFRQELVNGIIDKECVIISKNLIKKYN